MCCTFVTENRFKAAIFTVKGPGQVLATDTSTDFEAVLRTSPLTSIQTQVIAQTRSLHLGSMAETTFHLRT